MLVQNAF